MEEVLLAKWLCQLLLALDYLQTQQVLHRDIKTSNLMLTAEDDVQLGDFGLATMMKEEGGLPLPLPPTRTAPRYRLTSPQLDPPAPP